MQFRLTDNPPVKGGVLLLLLVAAGGEIAILVAFLYVTNDAESALGLGIFLLAMAVVVALSAWLMHRGVIELTEEWLEVRTVQDKRLIEWGDVAGARVRTVSQLGKVDQIFAAFAGSAGSRRLVEIQLNRPFRHALLPWQRDGTAAVGPPALPSKKMRVYVLDPEGLVGAIARHLQRPNILDG